MLRLAASNPHAPSGPPVIQAELAGLVLDYIAVGAVVTDGQGAVLFHTREAEHDDSVRMEVGKRLHFHDVVADARFRILLRRQSDKSDVLTDGAGQPVAMVERLGNLRLVVLKYGHGRTDALIRSCGLTAAEERLLRLLLEGGVLSDAARTFGVSLHTVRNQLRAIFAKAGVCRQADLIRRFTAR